MSLCALPFVLCLRFGSDMINHDREKFEQIMRTYFKKGGSQAMITVI